MKRLIRLYRKILQEYNNRDTTFPEWYFTQMLTWIRDHQEFLNERIQPELEKAELGHVNALVEFIRGLVILVTNKMELDITQLLSSDVLFAHLIDETLAFHHELHTIYSYPAPLHSCLHVLIQPEPFHKWKTIEKKFALEKMDAMLSLPTRWNCQYQEIADVDELKLSECGETFMMLISTLTDRYRSLPLSDHRLEFAHLQLELLEDFRVRLLQVRKEMLDSEQSVISPQMCSILNTVSYIEGILQQWNNLPFFVKLQYHKQQQSRHSASPADRQLATEADSDDMMRGDGSHMDSSNGDAFSKSELLTDVASSLVDDNDMEVSLFDDVIRLYQMLLENMLDGIKSYIFDDVKARSRPYRTEKWLAMPSQKDFVSLALSNSACEMLRVLNDHLHQMQTLLSKSLFNDFWQHLAARLNEYILKEVILSNKFNEGGAMQLQYDMTRNVFPLFAAYSAKPENYFKDVKEACTVLSLSAGSALLLKEILYNALHESRNVPLTDPVAALHDIGVYKTQLEDVELLLSLRVDLTVT